MYTTAPKVSQQMELLPHLSSHHLCFSKGCRCRENSNEACDANAAALLLWLYIGRDLCRGANTASCMCLILGSLR